MMGARMKMKQFLIMLNPMSLPKMVNLGSWWQRRMHGECYSAGKWWWTRRTVWTGLGTWQGKGEASKNSPAAKLHACMWLNCLIFRLRISCKFLVLLAVDFGACRAWIPRPFLQAKFWHLCLRDQREIQEAGNIRKGEKGKAGRDFDLAWAVLVFSVALVPLQQRQLADQCLFKCILPPLCQNKCRYDIRVGQIFLKFNWMCKKNISNIYIFK
jgi:hypothetical protein